MRRANRGIADHIRNVERLMHDSFEPPDDDQNIYQSWSIKLIALPLLIVIALIGMVVSHPSAVNWVSDTAQAESVGPDFVGPDIVPDDPRPTRLAQPTMRFRTIRGD
ncbi:hypothetical protein [Bradyrhizobium cenepequi]|uniref:hypothetical protein n=1 Tax=Bradyrhizobium cenepequi TaxID=2821403 RepID=UPI001CE26D5C|nr:hypothetical protein [Bradyrhizobium cenepequi]MCA6106919.1 hypothetical protein [Bradyrhizobium cenepequi]